MVLKTSLRKAKVDAEVTNSSIENIPPDVDLVVTHRQLLSRAKELNKNNNMQFMEITNFIEAKQYIDIVEHVKKSKE